MSIKYEGVLEAVKEYQRAQEIVLTDRSKQFQIKAWPYIEKRNKTVQSVTAGSETVPTAAEKGNTQCEELNWKSVPAKCHKCTPNTQLRWF